LQLQHPLLLAGSNKPAAAEKAEEAATANKGVARPVKMSNYFAKMLQNSREQGSGKKQIPKQIQSPYSSTYTKNKMMDVCSMYGIGGYGQTTNLLL